MSLSRSLSSACLALAIATSACSTLKPESSGRQGLLQRLESESERHARTEEGGSEEAAAPAPTPTSSPSGAVRLRKHASVASGPESVMEEGEGGAAAALVSDDDLASIRKAELHWPLRNVKITSRFGKRRRGFHEGVDLHANSGTPVFASQKGVVLYADRRIHGYGKMVILRHDNGLSTVYAHNSRLLVHKGQRVMLGQKIAISGRTGRVSGPHVHFEVRKGITVIDPAQVIPSAARAVAEAPGQVEAPGSD